jgi:hypothetical protein
VKCPLFKVSGAPPGIDSGQLEARRLFARGPCPATVDAKVDHELSATGVSPPAQFVAVTARLYTAMCLHARR